MKRYEYVTIKSHGVIRKIFDTHREIIDKYASCGYRYAGYIPTKYNDYGNIIEIDLIFEKEE